MLTGARNKPRVPARIFTPHLPISLLVRAVPQFPDTVSKFLVLQNIFPDNLRRELLEKWLQRSGFLVLNRVSKAQNREIPCKIP